MTGGGHRGECPPRFRPERAPAGNWRPRDGQASSGTTETGRPIRRLQDPPPSDTDGAPFEVTVGWSPDGSIVATGGGQGGIVIWRATDGGQLRALQADTSWVWSVAFSPDGSRIAASGVVNDRAHSGMSPPASWWADCPIPTSSARWRSTLPAGRWPLSPLTTRSASGTPPPYDQIGRPLPGPETGRDPSSRGSIPAGTISSPSTRAAPPWCGLWVPTGGRSGPARWSAVP